MIAGSSKRTMLEALIAGVDVRGPDDCWPWTGQIMKNGYGRLYGDRRHQYAHIVAHAKVWPSGRRYCGPCRDTRQAEYRDRQKAS